MMGMISTLETYDESWMENHRARDLIGRSFTGAQLPQMMPLGRIVEDHPHSIAYPRLHFVAE